MSLISKQSFVKISREIVGIEQRYIEKQHILYLYETKLVSPNHTFRIKEIFDISFRKTDSNRYGTLYLHTNQGVFPFQVCSDPNQFISKINELTKN